MVDLTIRRAEERDLARVKQLADENKRELGFVLLPALQDALAQKRLLVAVLRGVVVGFAHFRNRKDGVTKIYQICVDRDHRRRNYGSGLLKTIEQAAREKGQASVCLLCPRDLEAANLFYRRLGYSIKSVLQGKLRSLFAWQLSLRISEVQDVSDARY